MRSSSEFKSVTRRGARASSTHLVVHARRTQSPPSRVGFVVSKAVGNAVTRNRVKRRLRHLVVELLPDSPPVLVVVRAKGAIDLMPAQQLRDEFEQTWRRTMKRLAPLTPADADAGQESP